MGRTATEITLPMQTDLEQNVSVATGENAYKRMLWVILRENKNLTFNFCSICVDNTGCSVNYCGQKCSQMEKLPYWILM